MVKADFKVTGSLKTHISGYLIASAALFARQAKKLESLERSEGVRAD